MIYWAVSMGDFSAFKIKFIGFIIIVKLLLATVSA